MSRDLEIFKSAVNRKKEFSGVLENPCACVKSVYELGNHIK